MSKHIIFIGLGNPGGKYRNTRHNIGYRVLDRLAQELNLEFRNKSSIQGELAEINLNAKSIMLLKPTTFMNDSGKAVRSLLKQTPLQKEEYSSAVFLIYDDLDLALGAWKVVIDSHPKQHNGVLSVIQEMGMSAFCHVRMGIDSREGVRATPPEEYVLQPFSDQENQVVEQMIKEVVQELSKRIDQKG